ncbi:flippase [Candidatus Pacearchaeota archaeon]|nr:flippase [Candidatus Pacearchaeota archaeon]
MNKEKSNIETNKSLRLIAKSSFILLIGLFLSKVIAYSYRIIIARSDFGLGPESGMITYGLFSLAVVITSLFLAIASLGLPSGVLRYVSYYRGKKDIKKISYVIKLSMIVSIATGILFGILLFLLSDFISISIFHDEGLIPFLKWFSITIPISLFTAIFIFVIQAYEKMNWYSFIRNILDNFVKLIAIFILIFFGFKINAIIFSYILGAISMLLVSLYVCKYKIPGIFKNYLIKPKEKTKINKDLFGYSWPLIFSGLLMFLFTSTDSILIGYIKDAASVGLYNAATPLAALLLIAPALFIQLFFPLITKEYARKNNQSIKDMSKQVGKWIFLINLPVLIILILFPGAIINLFFGPNYLSAAASLRFLAIGSFFYSIFMVSENLISMTGKSKILMYNILIVSIINLVLDFILVSKIGINGAAISSMTVYIIWSLITMVQARKYSKVIPLRKKMLLILGISLIPTLILLYLRSIFPINLITLILFGLLFLILYVFLLLIFKCFDKHDIMIIKSVKNKILGTKKTKVS